MNNNERFLRSALVYHPNMGWYVSAQDGKEEIHPWGKLYSPGSYEHHDLEEFLGRAYHTSIPYCWVLKSWEESLTNWLDTYHSLWYDTKAGKMVVMFPGNRDNRDKLREWQYIESLAHLASIMDTMGEE